MNNHEPCFLNHESLTVNYWPSTIIDNEHCRKRWSPLCLRCHWHCQVKVNQSPLFYSPIYYSFYFFVLPLLFVFSCFLHPYCPAFLYRRLLLLNFNQLLEKMQCVWWFDEKLMDFTISGPIPQPPLPNCSCSTLLDDTQSLTLMELEAEKKSAPENCFSTLSTNVLANVSVFLMIQIEKLDFCTVCCACNTYDAAS